MKNKIRFVLFNDDNNMNEIWEGVVGERSRIFDTVISHLKEFKDGRLEIKILK